MWVILKSMQFPLPHFKEFFSKIMFFRLYYWTDTQSFWFIKWTVYLLCSISEIKPKLNHNFIIFKIRELWWYREHYVFLYLRRCVKKRQYWHILIIVLAYLHIYHIVEKKEKRIYVKQYIFNQNLLHNKQVWYKCTFEVYSRLL